MADSDNFFAYSPGIYTDGARYFVDKKSNYRHDVQSNDHPKAGEGGSWFGQIPAPDRRYKQNLAESQEDF